MRYSFSDVHGYLSAASGYYYKKPGFNEMINHILLNPIEYKDILNQFVSPYSGSNAQENVFSYLIGLGLSVEFKTLLTVLDFKNKDLTSENITNKLFSSEVKNIETFKTIYFDYIKNNNIKLSDWGGKYHVGYPGLDVPNDVHEVIVMMIKDKTDKKRLKKLLLLDNESISHTKHYMNNLLYIEGMSSPSAMLELSKRVQKLVPNFLDLKNDFTKMLWVYKNSSKDFIMWTDDDFVGFSSSSPVSMSNDDFNRWHGFMERSQEKSLMMSDINIDSKSAIPAKKRLGL